MAAPTPTCDACHGNYASCVKCRYAFQFFQPPGVVMLAPRDGASTEEKPPGHWERQYHIDMEKLLKELNGRVPEDRPVTFEDVRSRISQLMTYAKESRNLLDTALEPEARHSPLVFPSACWDVGSPFNGALEAEHTNTTSNGSAH